MTNPIDPILAAEAADLHRRLLDHAVEAEGRNRHLGLHSVAVHDLNLAVALLAEIGRTTPAERRAAINPMQKPANRLTRLAALLTR